MSSGCFLFGNNHTSPEVRRIKYVLKAFGVNRNLYLQQLCNLTLGKLDCLAFDLYNDVFFSLKIPKYKCICQYMRGRSHDAWTGSALDDTYLHGLACCQVTDDPYEVGGAKIVASLALRYL